VEILGTPQSDLLKGTSGNETISGLAGNDTIDAGAGNDIIFGDIGTDNLFGGAGRDTFAYNSPTEGFDKINDFVASDDFFAFSRTGFGGNVSFGSDPVGILSAARHKLRPTLNLQRSIGHFILRCRWCRRYRTSADRSTSRHSRSD
jgi:Ca2+-binding RTX toxin-like protein